MMRKLFPTTLQGRFIAAFVVLIIFCSIFIAYFSARRYRDEYLTISYAYIQDIASQISHNIQEQITKVEELTFNLLSNSVIQSSLHDLDDEQLSVFEQQKRFSAIKKQLGPYALYSDKIVSLSVISLDDSEITIQRLQNQPIVTAFSDDEVYAAKGSPIWGVADNGNIVLQRAIYSLTTITPIGSINIVYDNSYLNDIIRDMSIDLEGGTYIVTEDSMVVSSNLTGHVGESLVVTDTYTDIPTFSVLHQQPSYYYVDKSISNGWHVIISIPIVNLMGNIRAYWAHSILVSLLVVCIAIVICVLITHYSIRPMKVLQKIMQRFGEGDRTLRMKMIAPNEIGEISCVFNQMADSIEDLLENVLRLEIAQRQAEIEYLKMQINPHFLYNTLDTMHWLSEKYNAEDLSDISIALAHLLRASVDGEKTSSIQKEVELLKKYVFIQHFRFGDKIAFHFTIDDSCLDVIIPRFIMQPLVENAIIHGLEPKVENGTIQIIIKQIHQQIRLEVSDDGIGMTQEQIDAFFASCNVKHNLKEIGLMNVYRRLWLMYGDQTNFTLESKKDGGLSVWFCIPMS